MTAPLTHAPEVRDALAAGRPVVGEAFGLVGLDLGLVFEQLFLVVGLIDLRRRGGRLRGKQRLGGSALAQVFRQVGAEAPDVEHTDWAQIVVLYDLLLARGEDPVVRMNRAIAVGRAHRPEEGLALLEKLAEEPELRAHSPFHAALALFHEETGQHSRAVEDWERALELGGSEGERRFLEQRLENARART